MTEEKVFCPRCRCEFPPWIGRCPNCNAPLAPVTEELPRVSEPAENPVAYDVLVDTVRKNDQLRIDLATVDVGMEKKWRFPYTGYGFAWAKRMQGHIGGNEVTLTARKVEMEKKWRFPYTGYGFAWVQEMSGECGDRLKVDLVTTDVGREKKWRFPYTGYGFAWVKKGILTVTLKE